LRELLTLSCEFYITKNILYHSLIWDFFMFERRIYK